MKLKFLIFAWALGACASVTHTVEKSPVLPELGTIGVFNEYVLDSRYNTKAVPVLEDPVRLQLHKLVVQERAILAGKDSVTNPVDSALFRFEILDKIGLVRQLNANKASLEYLKKAEDCRIVTAVTLHLDAVQQARIETAESYYLVQKDAATLAIELRKEDQSIDIFEFNDATIVDVDYNDFCWGQNRRREIVIFDMITPDESCNPETYRSARKAKKKHQIDFWK